MPNDEIMTVDAQALRYAFQDQSNNAGMRVVDLCYKAFVLAKRPNDEDGGPSDWFTDTRPTIAIGIQKIFDSFILDEPPKTSPRTVCVPDLEEAVRRLTAENSRLKGKIAAAVDALEEVVDYNSVGMGCGLEDRNITDRYAAMAYGWECATDKIYEDVIGSAQEILSAD